MTVLPKENNTHPESRDAAGYGGRPRDGKINLISADPIVSAIFESVSNCDGSPDEKLKAVIRSGEIAKAFSCGGTAFDAVKKVFEK